MTGWRLFCRACRKRWWDGNDQPDRRCPFCASLRTIANREDAP